MRLTQKKIEEIMLSILGEDGLPLVKELSGKQHVSEFELADKLKKDIKVVRKMLYLLYNFNLVSFIRKKDKIKGWYIYYWTLLPESIKFNYIKRKKELLAKLQQRLEEETRELFYTCPTRCVRLNFDQAMDFEFHCPECGELASQDNNAERVETLRKKVAEIEAELKGLLEERKVRRKEVKTRKKERTVKKKRQTRVKAAKKNSKPKSKKTAAKKVSKKK